MQSVDWIFGVTLKANGAQYDVSYSAFFPDFTVVYTVYGSIYYRWRGHTLHWREWYHYGNGKWVELCSAKGQARTQHVAGRK